MHNTNVPELSDQEKKALEQEMEQLEPRMFKAKKEYEAIVAQYAKLLERRYPEREEERIKDTLYKAYQKSERTLEEILAYITGEYEE